MIRNILKHKYTLSTYIIASFGALVIVYLLFDFFLFLFGPTIISPLEKRICSPEQHKLVINQNDYHIAATTDLIKPIYFRVTDWGETRTGYNYIAKSYDFSLCTAYKPNIKISVLERNSAGEEKQIGTITHSLDAYAPSRSKEAYDFAALMQKLSDEMILLEDKDRLIIRPAIVDGTSSYQPLSWLIDEINGSTETGWSFQLVSEDEGQNWRIEIITHEGTLGEFWEKYHTPIPERLLIPPSPQSS